MQHVPPDATPDGWSRVAPAYERFVSPFLEQFAQAALDLTKLSPGERVLDVAAGAGALSLLAAQAGAKVLATDFAPGMVEQLKARAKAAGIELEVAQMDGQALDLEDGGFDAAYSNFGLIFFPDRARGFTELARVLAPGGRAAVTAWSRPETSEVFQVLQDALSEVAPELPPPPRPPAAFSLADPDLFEAEMREAGFSSVEVHQVTGAWELPSPEVGLEAMTTSNPVMPPLIARVGPAREDALRDAILEQLRGRVDGGVVRMNAEAHIGVGWV